MEKKDPIQEARRYVENAKTLLTEKAELDVDAQCYQDKKYVKMAGNTLWNGVLYILNKTFNVEKKKGRLSINDYREILEKRDRKLLVYVNDGYNILHLSMGYDGIQQKSVCQEGVRIANEIIDRCATMINPLP